MTDHYGVGGREIIEPLPLHPMMATFEKVSKVKNSFSKIVTCFLGKP